MMEHAVGNDYVECFVRERRTKQIHLQEVRIADRTPVAERLRQTQRVQAQIAPKDAASPYQPKEVTELTCSAATLQDL